MDKINQQLEYKYTTGDNLFALTSEYNKCYRDMIIWGTLIRDKSSNWYIKDEGDRDYVGHLLNDILATAARGNRSMAISTKIADKENIKRLFDHMRIGIDTQDTPYENHYLLRW